MDTIEIIERLESRKVRMVSALPDRKRLYFEKLEKIENERGILLYGPRGVGKTTYLLINAKKYNFFYVSGDDPLLSQISLYNLGERIFLEGFNGLIIDEVHFLNNWSLQIKSLYDSFPDKKIWISDSSSIILRKGIADLSRRFIKVRMPLLSFREYIHLATGVKIDEIESPFTFDREYIVSLTKDIEVLKLFKEYSSSGTRPFFLEGNFSEKMKNVLEKTLYNDIPYFLESVRDNHLRLMNAIISYLLYSKIPTINVDSMCKEWGVGKPKLYELMRVMEESELINIVYKERNFKVNSKGDKIFPSDPSYYYIYDGEIGNFREAFVVFALKEKGNVYSIKNEKDGDFIFNGIKIEVGGKNKKRKNSEFVIRDDLDLPIRNKIPLWVLGLLW
ncbi:MAG: ATP-binding protein [Candidatus Cloacimonetes bacterium]|nr:ATP-binding protein [Candidatus Cloacimonadota bacterium]